MGGATVDSERLRLNSEPNYTGYIFIVLMQRGHGGFPHDRNGAFSVGELNSPRVAPLHRWLTLSSQANYTGYIVINVLLTRKTNDSLPTKEN